MSEQKNKYAEAVLEGLLLTKGIERSMFEYCVQIHNKARTIVGKTELSMQYDFWMKCIKTNISKEQMEVIATYVGTLHKVGLNFEVYEAISSIVKEKKITYEMLQVSEEIIETLLAFKIASNFGISSYDQASVQESESNTTSSYISAISKAPSMVPSVVLRQQQMTPAPSVGKIYIRAIEGKSTRNLYAKYIQEGKRPCESVTECYDRPKECTNKNCKDLHFDKCKNTQKYAICCHVLKSEQKTNSFCELQCGLPVIISCPRGINCPFKTKKMAMKNNKRNNWCSLLHP